MLYAHAPVFTSPRKHPPGDERAAEGPDAELPAEASTRRAATPGGYFLKQVHNRPAQLAALQTTVAQSLSSSVAQPTPPSVARRSAQRRAGRASKKRASHCRRAAALFAGHAGAREGDGTCAQVWSVFKACWNACKQWPCISNKAMRAPTPAARCHCRDDFGGRGE